MSLRDELQFRGLSKRQDSNSRREGDRERLWGGDNFAGFNLAVGLEVADGSSPDEGGPRGSDDGGVAR